MIDWVTVPAAYTAPSYDRVGVRSMHAIEPGFIRGFIRATITSATPVGSNSETVHLPTRYPV